MKVGDRLGRFELTRELGRGSHGVVFEATDVLLGERVAIKALQPWLAGDVTLRERFKRELVLTRRVSHPGVARLHDLHEENGILFISMQYVEGKSLSQILRVALPPEDKVIHILRGVCGALSAAHDEGVIHRDLKPANIMLTDTDKVIVLDFGIATATGGVGQQLTRPGEAMGSVPYVAPEIWEGGAATALGDQYALAVTGFVCLTRELPYNGKSPLEVLDAIRTTQATVRSRVPSVAADIEAVVLRAMSKKPEDRYPTIADFDEALRQLAERRGHVTKPPSGAAPIPSGPVPVAVPQAVVTPLTAADAPATIPQLQAPMLEPVGASHGDAGMEAVVAALAEDEAVDAGAAAVAAAMEEEAFSAAFDAALPDVQPQLGGAAAAIFVGPPGTAVEPVRDHTAVEGPREEPTAVVPAPREESTAIIPAPQLSGGDPLTVASSAFVITNDPTATVVEGAPRAEVPDAVAADVEGMNAVADAFEASVAGKPPVERTALVDRKQRLAELAGDATMVAPMPEAPEAPPKKKPIALVAAGLAVVAVVLGIALTRGGDDDVAPPEPPPVAEPPPPPPATDPPEPPPPPPVTEPTDPPPPPPPATDPPEPPPPPATEPTDPPPPPAPILTLDDLEAPPDPDPEPDPEPPPPDPTGAPRPRLSTAGLDSVVAAAAKKGIRGGDVAAYDAAVSKGRKAARNRDKAALDAATKAAKTAVDATTIDKAFVSDKLARFNRDFDKVKDPALKAKVQPIAREVLKHISKGQWSDANTKLNTSWSMIRKGR